MVVRMSLLTAPVPTRWGRTFSRWFLVAAIAAAVLGLVLLVARANTTSTGVGAVLVVLAACGLALGGKKNNTTHLNPENDSPRSRGHDPRVTAALASV